MITEKRFVSSYGSFWAAAAPRLRGYVRRCNLGLDRFAEPYARQGGANRGVINETAFRLYCAARRDGLPVADASESRIEEAARESVAFVRRFRQASRTPVTTPDAAGLEEAMDLAQRLGAFVDSLRPREIVLSPTFPGCGWIEECNGDLILDATLCEVKAGGSLFRSADIKQLLVYAALNSEAQRYRIGRVCLVNPRLGVFLNEALDDVCLEISGTSASQLLFEIVSHVSEPVWRDEAV